MSTPSPGRVQIVRATGAGLPAISDLASVIWRACYPGIIPAEQIDYMLARMYALDTMRRETDSQGIRYERMLMDDRLIGFASYGPTDDPVVFKVHKLYVHPDYHGCGLGSRLLNHCESEVRKSGAGRLILNVNKSNVRAIEVYERNGYAIVEAVVADIGGGFVMDDYVMAKALPR